MTERLLVEAGIGPSMRVLDVGCGSGDVSILVSHLVGPAGEVVGIDREPRMLEAARERVRELGLSNVTFLEGDFGELDVELGLFDAVVGRRVLMYQAEPVAVVRRLAKSLEPGGVILFQEVDSTVPTTSLHSLPLHEKVQGWIWKTLACSGTHVHMGFELYQVFEQAGLSEPEVRAEAIVETPRTPDATTPLIRMLLPRMVEYGIATEEEVDLGTLERRLLEERRSAGTAFIGQVVFGAWARRTR